MKGGPRALNAAAPPLGPSDAGRIGAGSIARSAGPTKVAGIAAVAASPEGALPSRLDLPPVASCPCSLRKDLRVGARVTSAVAALKAEPGVRCSGEPTGMTACVKMESSRSQKASNDTRVLLLPDVATC